MLTFLFFLLLTMPNTDTDLFSLDLEELLETKIVTASRSEESPWEASSVVTVINRSEIALFGADHLYDVLTRVPGLTPYVSAGIDRISIRGGDPGVSIFHTLLLIDGRPLRTSGGNLSLYYVFYGMPLSMIERIEVIRGPGAVLYGTNAMEGVINIITHSSKEDVAEVSINAGSDNQKGVQALLRQRKGNWRFHLGALYFDADGWDYETPDPVTAGETNESKAVFHDTKSIRLIAENDYWQLSLFGGKTKQFGFTQFLPELSFHSEVWQGNLAYNRQINSKWRMEHQVTFNSEDFAWINDKTSIIPMETRDYLFESTFFGKLNDHMELILGASAQRNHTQNLDAPFSQFFDHKSNGYSAYGQLSYKKGQNIFLVGAQFNKVEGYATDLVPRLSYTRRLSENLGLSFFYADAYRSPQGLELNINSPGVQRGNPDLESESLSNYETRLFYHTEETQISVSAFKAKQEDLVNFIPNDDFSIGTAQNTGELTIEGAEFEIRYIPKSKYYASASYTYQQNENAAGMEDITGMPNWSAKLGLGYHAQKFSLGLYHMTTGRHHQTELDQGLPYSWTPESATSHNLSFNFGMTLLNRENMNTRLEIFGNNLTDDETRVRDIFFRSYNSLPGQPDRSGSAKLRIRF